MEGTRVSTTGPPAEAGRGPRASAVRTRVAALVLVAAAWLVVLRGLFLLPASDDPALDLDAGPAFSVNVSVYLPALVLCVVLLVALPVSVAARKGAVVGALAALAVCCFALWVLGRQELVAYLPGLAAALWLATGLAGAGLLTFVIATVRQGWSTSAAPEDVAAHHGS